jgi:hypothetical protein
LCTSRVNDLIMCILANTCVGADATMFTLKDVEDAGSLARLRALAQDFDVEDARRRSAARFAQPLGGAQKAKL